MMLDNKKIGVRILNLRKHSNMTQMELSEMLGVSHQAVSKWENGECLPDIEVLLRLAKIFNLSVEGILLYDINRDENEQERQIESSFRDSTEKLWADVLKDIHEQINIHSYNTWFKNTTGTFEGDIFVITCPNRFSTEWLFHRYSSLIAKTLDKLTGKSQTKIRFQTFSKNQFSPAGKTERAELFLDQ